MPEFIEHNFAVYELQFGRPSSPRNLRVADANGTDLYSVIAVGLSTQQEADVDGQSIVHIEFARRNDTTRNIFGIIQRGRHGEKRPIYEVDRTANTAQKSDMVLETDQSPTSSHFFNIYVPSVGDRAFLMIQQRGNISNQQFLDAKISKLAQEHNLSLRMKRLAPLEHVDMLRRGALKKVVFIKKGGHAMDLLNVEDQGSLREIGKVTVTVEARPGVDLSSFRRFITRNNNDVGKNYFTRDQSDLEVDSVRYSVEINGRSFTGSSETDIAGRPTFVEHFDVSDPGLMARLVAYSQSVFESLLDV